MNVPNWMLDAADLTMWFTLCACGMLDLFSGEADGPSRATVGLIAIGIATLFLRLPARRHMQPPEDSPP